MKLNKQVKMICFATLVWAFGNSVNFAIVFFVPDQFGVNEFWAGVAIAIIALGSIVGALSFPKISKYIDIVSHHNISAVITLLSYTVAAVFYQNISILLLMTFMGMAGIANVTLINKKLIAIVSSGEERRDAYSLNFVMVNFGSIFSPIIASYLYSLGIEMMQYIFIFNGVLTVISSIIIKIFVHDITAEEVVDSVESTNHSNTKFIKSNIIFLICLFLMYFAFWQLLYLIPKSVELNINLMFASVIAALNTILCIVLLPIISKLIRNISTYQAIMYGCIFLAIGLLLFTFTTSKTLAVAGIIFITIADVLIFTNIDTALSIKYKSHEYDVMLVINKFIIQLVKTINPIIIGGLLILFGYSSTFVVCSAIALSAAILYQYNKKNN